jgi:P pilus assembly chaperone PapD
MNIKRFLVGCSLTFALLSVNANASLLIYPIRVSFDEIEKRAELTLSNTSTQTNTYRLAWVEKRALPERGYINLSEEEVKDQSIASSMLRFSPRQVTLQPGERQLIKLVLRRPRDLAEGEYRSHLLFKALPPEKNDNDEENTSTSINIVLSFSVPVTVQQGKYNAQVSLKGASIAYNPSTVSSNVSLKLAREGLHSSSGDISAYWTPSGGEETLIAKLADYNIWSELSEANISLVPTGAAFTPTDGRLRIHYEGVRDFRGNTYIDEVIEIKRKQIEIENKAK